MSAVALAGERGRGDGLYRAERIALEVALLPLLARAVVVDSLRITGATARLVRTEQGLELPFRPPEEEEPPDAPRDEPAGPKDEGLALAERTDNHYWTAELHRLRGDLTSEDKDAEPSCMEALSIARSQGAKVFELRAAMSLSRRWARQRKTREARALLSGIHGWFTEGLDTPDLKDATALLARLSRRG